MTVLFIDSGLGGISTLASSVSLVPDLNFIYFADDKYAPYGTKNQFFIRRRLNNIIKQFENQIDMVVLACNTATTVAIKYLRKRFCLPIIGTEPAIKVAAESNAKQIVVLSTPLTAKSNRMRELASHCNKSITTVPLPHLATNIDNYYLHNNKQASQEINFVIKQLKNTLPHSACVVLGCTHYCLVKDKIISELNLPVYDGNFGVAKQIAAHLSLKSTKKPTQNKFICSSKSITTCQKYQKIFEQTLAKTTNL